MFLNASSYFATLGPAGCRYPGFFISEAEVSSVCFFVFTQILNPYGLL